MAEETKKIIVRRRKESMDTSEEVLKVEKPVDTNEAPIETAVPPVPPVPPVTGAPHTPELTEDNMPVLPSFMKGATLKPATKEEVQAQMKPEPITVHASFGAATRASTIAHSIAGETEVRDKKLTENKFFSDAHKANVEHHNDMIENLKNEDSVSLITDNEEFEKLIRGEEGVSILDDNDENYAQSCCRNVISSVSYYYSVVLLHSGFKVNFTGLRYLAKSRLLNTPEDMYNERRRFYKTIWEQIESISGFKSKPSFEKWCRITSFLDTDSLLFGVYAATFPTDQKFNITCPNCGSNLEILANPENLVSVYSDEAYKQVHDVINNTPNAEDIIRVSAMSKREKLPVKAQKVMIYIKEPSIADYLEIIADVAADRSLYDKYELTYEKTMYIDYVLVPDIAFFKRNGKVRFVKVKSRKQIAEIISNLDSASGTKLDDILNNLNDKYNVRFEIPESVCHGMLKDEEGKFTGEKCGHKIEAVPVDLEKLLFRALRNGRTDDEVTE